MKILLINHYAGSLDYGMEFRPYYLSREWVKQGHEVHVLAADYSHLRTKQPEVSKSLTVENVDGVNYIWIKTPTYSSSGFKRVINILSFVFKIRWYSKKISKSVCPDLVITSSTYPLDIYPAKRISRRSKSKLVYEVHDLWPLSPMLIGGYSKWHPFIMLMQKAENDSYKKADKVVSLLWNAKEHMINHKMKESKFVCIPNGYCEDEWINSDSEELPKQHKDLFDSLKDKVIIGFSGGHTPSTAMETFIDSANILRNRKELAFVLVGDGVSKNQLIEKANKLSLDNVYFLPAVPKVLVPKVISFFDIAYMGGTHSVLHKYGTAFNKMTDYMLCKKPLLVSIDEPNSVVERVGCGIQVDAENPEGVAGSLLMFLCMSEVERSQMGMRGYEYAKNNLEYSKLAARFLEKI